MLIKQMFTTVWNSPSKQVIIKGTTPIIIKPITKNNIKENNNKEIVQNKEDKKIFYPFYGWVFY